MYEYTAGRFVNVSKIIGANPYTKDGVIKVAIDLDVVNKEKNTVYAGPFGTQADAIAYCKALPVLLG